MLSSHLFIMGVNEILAKMISEVTDTQNLPKQIREYTPDEKYVKRVFLAFSEIQTILKQLTQATQSLSGYRATKRFKEAGIGRFDHIIYHLENFYIRIIGCFDRCLLLVNATLDLGLSHKECTYKRINSSVCKFPTIVGQLSEINGVVKPFRNNRDSIAHRRRLRVPELWNLEGLYVIQELPDIIADKSILSLYSTKILTDSAVAEQQQQMEEIIQQITKRVEKLLTGLQPHFHKKLEHL